MNGPVAQRPVNAVIVHVDFKFPVSRQIRHVELNPWRDRFGFHRDSPAARGPFHRGHAVRAGSSASAGIEGTTLLVLTSAQQKARSPVAE